MTVRRLDAQEDEAPAIDGVADDRKRSVLLTARDKELFLHLAVARYLSTDQIEQLVFVGKSITIVRRRLRRLATARHLRRVPYRTSDGDQAVA